MDPLDSNSQSASESVGGTAALVRSKDWSATALGPRDEWPRSLHVLVDAILPQSFPVLLLWGPELIQIYNDGYAMIAADKHPQALGRPTYECWPEVIHVTRPLYQRVLRGESISIEDEPFKLARGKALVEAFLTVSYSPVRDGDGAVAGILAIVFDTTARVQSERARARAEAERLALAEQRRLALEAAELGWWSYDIVLGRVKGDERLKAMTGITDESIDVERMLSIVHPDDRQFVQDSLRRAADGLDALPLAIEYRFIRPDGSIGWIASKGLAASEAGEDRGARKLFGTAVDVTEKKRAEAMLRANAERLNLALAAAALGDWEWDAASDLITLSDRGAEIYGLEPGRKYTRTWMRTLLHPDYREHARIASERAAEEHGDYDNEYPVIRPDGTQVWVAARGRGLYEASGTLTRMVGIVQDISRRKEAEKERDQLLQSERAARAESERTNRMKDEFLATLSHELRTPLNAIIGWSQLLRGGPINAKDLAEGLEVIERNGRAQAQIIEDLLDMNRIISGKIRLDVQNVDLADVIRAGVETVRPAAVAKDIRLVTALDPRTGQVIGDPNRLQQVIWNLLINAVKFTAKGGLVQVALKRVDSHVEVGVVDTGVGIKPEFLPYVFDRFRQADSSMTRKHSGLGLGLAIVKQLVELHGGTVRVESDGEEKGSAFTVVLPTSVLDNGNPDGGHSLVAASATRALQDRHGQVPLRGIKVLVVDDEPDARALVKRLLEDCDASVQTAASAAEAMERMCSERFDVLVSDIGMPGEDGYTLMRKVRALGDEHSGALPALALTAYARSEDRLNAIRAGFNMHVVKPVEPVELVTMVASLAGAIGRPQS